MSGPLLPSKQKRSTMKTSNSENEGHLAMYSLDDML